MIDMSRVFLQCQIWTFNYYAKSQSKNLSYEKIKAVVSVVFKTKRELKCQNQLENTSFLFILQRIFDGIFDVIIYNPYLTQQEDSAMVSLFLIQNYSEQRQSETQSFCCCQILIPLRSHIGLVVVKKNFHLNLYIPINLRPNSAKVCKNHQGSAKLCSIFFASTNSSA